MPKHVVWGLIGYLVGSFFGVSQVLGLFSGVTGGISSKAA